MAVKTSTSRRRKVKSKARKRLNLQKPSGVIGPRVAKVGGTRFAIVCVDPAKHRSEWMMADYFGNVLIEQQTLEHQAAFFRLAVEQIRQAHFGKALKLASEFHADASLGHRSARR